MEKNKVYIAIMGAITKSVSDSGFIASSQNFSENYDLKNAVWEFDKELRHILGSYKSENFVQIFCFQKRINNAEYKFLIRSQKDFTKFERGRAYDRREYFFYDIANEYDVVDFVKSLPDMEQYKEDAYGKETFPKIEKCTYSPHTQISKVILFSLLNNKTVKIKISDNVQDIILNAISIFPTCYKKYIGFGFNVKDDSFTKTHLHIFSTFDDDAVDIDAFKKSNNEKWNKFVEYLSDKNKNQYNDTEISKSEINRNTLYKLLDYHKLHYQIDYKVLEPDEILKQKTLSYVFDFVKKEFTEKEEKKYIDKRIEEIINFWERKDMLEQSDLPNLFDKEMELKKLFENNFLIIIVKLLKKENLEIQIQWKNKYDEVDKIIPLVSTSDLSDFELVCTNYFREGISKFVQDSINLEGNREYVFYQISLETANKHNFQISLEKKDIVSNRDKTLLEFYTLFDKEENRNKIINIDNVLCNIAIKIIEDEVNTIEDTLMFFRKHKKFTAKYIEDFVKRITELYNSHELEKEQCLKLFNPRKKLQSTKIESKDKIIQLINTIINSNYYKNEKMKSIIDIERSNKKWKWIAISTIVISLFAISYAIYIIN